MKGLTLTIVTPKIQSINYGETIGNVSTLKKLSTGTDYPKKLITYFSDKAIKFDVKRIGRDQFNWNLMNKSVVSVFVRNYQNGNFNHDNFLKNMIAEYEEFDLFGGMFADIGNVSNEIKQTMADENALSSLITGLDDDTAIRGGKEPKKVKKIKQYLKSLSDLSGKTVLIQSDSFSIDEIKSDASKLSELKNKIAAIGRKEIAIKIDGEDKKKKDIEEIIEAIEVIQSLIGQEISCEKSLTIKDTNKLKRSQPVRYSNGYSIAEFVYDMNLLNDIDAYNRYIQYTAGQKKQSLVYPEEHFSYYTYTLTIDLDKVGAIEKEEDGRVIFEPVIDPYLRAKRVNDILEIVLLYLNREIKGRKERLTPIFLIGGVYDVKHPFFANAIYFSEQNQKLHFKTSDIQRILDTYQSVNNINCDTYLHYDDSFVVADGTPLEKPSNEKLSTILQKLKEKVSDYYFKKFVNYANSLIEKLENTKKISVDQIKVFREKLSTLEAKQRELTEQIYSLIKERTDFIEEITQKILET